jgi:D-psicose/D-tagatose/L-ribulose 3-epimerase
VKLAFSNIAWDAAEEGEVLALLGRAGIAGIEVAPSKCWPDWKGITQQSVVAVRQRFAGPGFSVPSLQAILFGHPELKLFGDEAALDGLLRHTELVAGVATGLGAKTLVFGAPANRDPGDLPPEEAMNVAVPRMRALGEICARHDVWLGIEANPAAYNCRFMTRWFEAAELVRRCDSPGVRLHLDAACTLMAGDDIAEAVEKSADILAHVHVSEPQLGNFDAPKSDHARFAEALKQVGYQGWCSVEMRRAPDPVAAIGKAIEVAQAYYD